MGLARAGAELDGVSWTPRVPSTIALHDFQQSHRDLILLTAQQILICFVFSSAPPASVVFSGAVSSCTL